MTQLMHLLATSWILFRLVCGQDMITYGSYTYLFNHSPVEFNTAELACS